MDRAGHQSMKGLWLEDKKKYLISWAVHHAKIPSRVWIPVPLGTELLVRIGDQVKTGEVIGKPESSDQIFLHVVL